MTWRFDRGVKYSLSVSADTRWLVSSKEERERGEMPFPRYESAQNMILKPIPSIVVDFSPYNFVSSYSRPILKHFCRGMNGRLSGSPTYLPTYLLKDGLI